MAELSWDNDVERIYESGIDHGVLYSEGLAVPWNGLISVIETFENDDVEAIFVDGVKTMDHQKTGDFKATLSAFTYPDEFLEFEGYIEQGSGLFAGDQVPKLFDLSYRTKIGSAVNDQVGYKIHLVYGLTAIPQDLTYETHAAVPQPLSFQWDIFSVPQATINAHPTAHVIIDTSRINEYFLTEIESILYGTMTAEARMPSMIELQTMAENWTLFKVTDHGDGVWSIEGPDEFFEMIDSTTFRIDETNATYISPDTYEVSSA